VLERAVAALSQRVVAMIGLRPFTRELYHIFVDGWGASYVDVDRTLHSIRELGNDGWARGWAATAQRYLWLAREAEAAGLRASGSALYKRASLYFRIADVAIDLDTPLKRALYRQCVDAYARFAALNEPPIDRLTFHRQAASVAGYLHRPLGAGKAPCVIIIPGLGSAKEQPDFPPEVLTARGIAAFPLDIPGHGEAFQETRLTAEAYQAVSDAFDVLAAHPAIDERRIAVLGTSLGGTVALKAASEDDRFCAVVNISGFYEPRDWFEASARFVEAALKYVTGIAGGPEVRELVGTFTLRGAIGRIGCPLLTVHGGRDSLIPIEEARRIHAEAVCPNKLVTYPSGDHALCNTPEARFAILDWLAEQMAQTASQPVSLAG